MPGQTNDPHVAIPIAVAAAAAVPEFALVNGAGALCALNANRDWAGAAQTSLASGALAGTPVTVRLGGAGTHKLIASEAILVGDPIYKAANGRVSKTATSSVQVGIALTAASGAGSIFEAILGTA